MPKLQPLKIEITHFEFETILGILPKERVNKQRVVVNLSFEYEFDSEKKNFIDYSEVTRVVEEIFTRKKFELIEEALLFIKKDLYQKYPLQNLQLKITKPDIIDNCQVAVSLS